MQPADVCVERSVKLLSCLSVDGMNDIPAFTLSMGVHCTSGDKGYVHGVLDRYV